MVSAATEARKIRHAAHVRVKGGRKALRSCGRELLRVSLITADNTIMGLRNLLRPPLPLFKSIVLFRSLRTVASPEGTLGSFQLGA